MSLLEETLEACLEIATRFCSDKYLYSETKEDILEDPKLGAEKFRNHIHCGEYRHNRIKCKTCGDVIESMNRHDFVTCSCGKVSVDGGTMYLRRVGELDGYEEMSEVWPWLKEGKPMEFIEVVAAAYVQRGSEERMKEKLERAFNSASYDFNVLKDHVFFRHVGPLTTEALTKEVEDA